MKNHIGGYKFIAGIGTALVVTAVSGMVLWHNPLFVEAMIWQSLIIVAVFIITNQWMHESNNRISLFALWGVVPLIFALSWRVPVDIFYIYTIIWAACIPFYLTIKTCWSLLLLINVAWYAVRFTVWQESNPLTETLLVSTFHVFALLSAMGAKVSQESNEKAQQLNRELVATQHLLAEASRDRERTRIARDLHDLLGHHLTALTINLQVAAHISKGDAKEKIDQCHSLAKLLLSDVREAVSTLRDMPLLNLRELLEMTIRDIPRIQISLEMDEGLQIDDVNTADVLLRLVQEATTNTLKHSNARTALIKVHTQDDKIFLNYTDDGGGCNNLTVGNGLIGMRERVERINGKLQIAPTPNFSLQVSAPN